MWTHQVVKNQVDSLFRQATVLKHSDTRKPKEPPFQGGHFDVAVRDLKRSSFLVNHDTKLIFHGYFVKIGCSSWVAVILAFGSLY
jgi:hypothetical protein